MRATLLFFLKLGLALTALLYLADRIEWGTLLGYAREAEPVWIIVAVAMMPFNIGLEAWRWHRLVVRIAPETRYRDSLSAVLSGYPLGLITPARAGDFIGRALYLPYKGKGELVALTFLERFATLACTLLAGLLALIPFLVIHSNMPQIAWGTLFTISLVAVSLLLVLLLHPYMARQILAAVLPFRRALRIIRILDRYNRKDTGSLMALSALRYGIFSTQFVLLVFAFDPTASWLPVAAGVSLVFFAKSAIPTFTLGDLGIREGAAVFFLGTIGIAAAAAFQASLLLFAINLLMPALAGLPFVLRLRIPLIDRANARPAESAS